MPLPSLTEGDAMKIWRTCGVTPAYLAKNAAWLCEPRELHGSALRHFEVAGSLIRFSRYDFKLASAAFFHSLIGLEQALKLHYRKETGYLANLLSRAWQDRLFNDRSLGETPSFSKEFARMLRKKIKNAPAGRSELLVQLLPQLRNEYMHGQYLLAPDFLHLTLQVRLIADALK